MTRMFCDRCDREVSQPIKVSIPGSVGEMHTLTVELCPRCVNHLRNEVKPLPKEDKRART